VKKAARKRQHRLHCVLADALEAQRDSGLSVPRYASAHQLPERALRRVKRQFTRTPPPQDWRELRHPVARSGTAAAAKIRYELRYDRPSGTAVEDTHADAETTARKPARRRYTDPQKFAIVAEAAEPWRVGL
jgi:hypothetical protein